MRSSLDYAGFAQLCGRSPITTIPSLGEDVAGFRGRAPCTRSWTAFGEVASTLRTELVQSFSSYRLLFKFVVVAVALWFQQI